MNLTEKTLKKEYQYQGKILKMRVDEVELPNGIAVCTPIPLSL